MRRGAEREVLRPEREGRHVTQIGWDVVSFLGAIGLALLGLAVARRLLPRESLRQQTDVVSAVYAALGVVYGVILGGVVVAAWNDYQAAEAATEAESAALVNLLRLSYPFPAPAQAQVRDAVVAYADAVIRDEWPAMEQGHPPAASAVAAAENLYRLYGTLGLGPVGRIPTYDAALSGLDDLDDARGARLLAATQGLPLGFWLVLVVGGAVVVGFAYLFAVEDRTTHAVLVVALATTIVLFLILVRGLSEPYAEPLRIGTRGYTRVFDLADVMRSPGPAPVPAATPAS